VRKKKKTIYSNLCVASHRKRRGVSTRRRARKTAHSRNVELETSAKSARRLEGERVTGGGVCDFAKKKKPGWGK